MIKYGLGDIMNYNFKEQLNRLDLTITEKQEEQFKTYYKLLVEWNEKMNLTAITDEDQVYQKHFIDSICFTKAVSLDNQSLLDIGSGAGFPSIPLLIMYPNLKVTIIDALKKRITFLEALTKELGIEVELIHGRAEEYKRKHCFDLVTARAVSNLRMLSELCIPFVKIDGYFISMKGPKLELELEESKDAIELLGGKVDSIVAYELNNEQRNILKVIKAQKTKPKYPRRFNQIKSNPL